MDNQAASRGAMSRRRPLHTCGASLLAVIHTACRKAQELNGPLGKWAKRTIKFMSLAFPLMYAVLYQWLAILSFTDECILTFEKLVETIFPPSTCLFDKIDNLVYTAEVMPGRFDEALNRFLVIMRAPFLDWALMQIMWWIYGNPMEERDIMIDMNSNTRSNVTESAENASSQSQEDAPSIYCPPQEKDFEAGKPESSAELPALEKYENNEKYTVENEEKTDHAKHTVESSTMNQSRDIVKGTEKQTSGKQTEAENTQEGSQQSSVSEEKVERDEEKGTQQSVEDKDPVLELFESKWHL